MQSHKEQWGGGGLCLLFPRHFLFALQMLQSDVMFYIRSLVSVCTAEHMQVTPPRNEWGLPESHQVSQSHLVSYNLKVSQDLKMSQRVLPSFKRSQSHKISQGLTVTGSHILKGLTESHRAPQHLTVTQDLRGSYKMPKGQPSSLRVSKSLKGLIGTSQNDMKVLWCANRGRAVCMRCGCSLTTSHMAERIRMLSLTVSKHGV